MTKFDSTTAEVLWAATLDGWLDDQVGDSSVDVWYGLLRGHFSEDDIAEYDLDVRFTLKHQQRLLDMAGAIIWENSQGFVGCSTYQDLDKLEHDWAECVGNYPEEVQA